MFFVETSSDLKSGFLIICYRIGNQISVSPHLVQKRTKGVHRDLLKNVSCALSEYCKFAVQLGGAVEHIDTQGRSPIRC